MLIDPRDRRPSPKYKRCGPLRRDHDVKHAVDLQKAFELDCEFLLTFNGSFHLSASSRSRFMDSKGVTFDSEHRQRTPPTHLRLRDASASCAGTRIEACPTRSATVRAMTRCGLARGLFPPHLRRSGSAIPHFATRGLCAFFSTVTLSVASMRRAFSWVWIAGYTEFVLRSVCAQAWFRRASNSKRNDVRFLGIRNNNHVEKRNGLVSNILLMDSEMITRKGVAFVASDFNGAAGSHKGSDPVRTVFRNTACPFLVADGTPLCALGFSWAVYRRLWLSQSTSLPRQSGAPGASGLLTSTGRLGLRPHGLSSHYRAFMHLSHVHADRKRPNRQERQAESLLAPFLGVASCHICEFSHDRHVHLVSFHGVPLPSQALSLG